MVLSKLLSVILLQQDRKFLAKGFAAIVVDDKKGKWGQKKKDHTQAFATMAQLHSTTSEVTRNCSICSSCNGYVPLGSSSNDQCTGEVKLFVVNVIVERVGRIRNLNDNT